MGGRAATTEEDPRDEARSPDPPLVLITWRDAWFDFEESDPRDAHGDYLVSTVGWLIREGPRFVSIGQEVLPHGDGFRAITHIPVSVIVDRVSLSLPITLEVVEPDVSA